MSGVKNYSVATIIEMSANRNKFEVIEKDILKKMIPYEHVWFFFPNNTVVSVFLHKFISLAYNWTLHLKFPTCFFFIKVFN